MRVAARLALSMVASVFLSSCGVKGPPQPPESYYAPNSAEPHASTKPQPSPTIGPAPSPQPSENL